MLTAARLKTLLDYDPDTGLFKWRVRKAGNVKVGMPITRASNNGYIYINIDQRRYGAHRLAWFYVHGHFPQIAEHIDGNPKNNRLVNLRAATSFQNNGNMKKSARNTSGYKGVTWHKVCGKWQAAIKVRGRNIHLGLFCDPREAHNAYMTAAAIHFGEFARAA